jgi:hypothetical protein
VTRFLPTVNWRKDRPIRDVPVPVWCLLIITFLFQLFWHSQQPEILARADALPEPLPAQAYILSSLDEPLAMAKILNLWLQSFDRQPGISLSYKQLDYARIAQWLDLSLKLDPEGRYPLLAAARVYGGVNDEKRKRFMMDYVFRKFSEAPNQRWPWLAHAVIIAKHELKDMPLALKYATALAEKATGKNVPYWARDMKIFLLEDMGEVESAKALIGGLLESGEITDQHELAFLKERIRAMEAKASSGRQGVE